MSLKPSILPSFFSKTICSSQTHQKLLFCGCCSFSFLHRRQNLSYLPERGIIDLNNIVILDQYSEQNFVNPETIVRSAASRSSSNSNSEQSTSTSDLTFHHHRKRSQAHRLNMSRTPSTRTLPGVPRQSMTLLLADNLLTRLPPQLFHLDRLTVLSLRACLHNVSLTSTH